MISGKEEKIKNTLIIIFLVLSVVLLTAAGLMLKRSSGSVAGEEPVFSKNSGFYDKAFDLELYAPEGLEIRYTLDGSEPDENSALYSAPIKIYDRSPEENLYADNPFISVDYFSYTDRTGYVLPEKPVDKCTVVRAAAFDKDGKKSGTITKSYFVGYSEKGSYAGTPVISLCVAPDDLFSYENGIYVIGKKGTEDFLRKAQKSEEAQAFLRKNPDTPLDGSVKIGNVYMHEAYVYNYSQGGADWERRGDISFFDAWHTHLLSGRLGVRVRGHNSRNFPQKSLSFFQREQYSLESFYYPYLKNKVNSGAALSAGGDDMYSLVRDPFLSELFRRNGLTFGVQEFSGPVFLFLDGEFWGTYLLSEKEDKDYLHRHYGVDSDNTLIVKNGVLESGREESYGKLYGELVKYVLEHDLSADENYNGFCDMVDIESLIDYYAARLYADDTSDWPKTNVALWRSVNKTERPYEDGKWRFLNFDNNIELQKGKTDFDSIGALLSMAEDDYGELKKDYNVLKDEGRGIEEMLGRNIFFERMLLYPLFQNEGFKGRFYKRFVEIEDSVYDTGEAEKLLDAQAEKNRLPVVTGYSRWFGDRCSFKDFDEKVDEIRYFLENRRQYIDAYMKAACGISG